MFRSGDYDAGFCSTYERDLLAPPAQLQEEVALIAAAVGAFERDRDEAEAFAARARAGTAARSSWVEIGRARALRGGRR